MTTYYFPDQDGEPFPYLLAYHLMGDGTIRKFKVEEAWNGGFVAHTTCGGKKLDCHGDTMLQAWRRMRRLLAAL